MNYKRLCAIYICFILLFSAVSVRIYVLSQNSGAVNVLSGQYTRKSDIAERRGFIFDRNGKILNFESSKSVIFVNPAFENPSAYKKSELLAKITEMPQSKIYEKISEGVPFSLISDKDCNLEFAKCFKIYDRISSQYLCHVLGYTDFQNSGVCGIEKAYDKFLTENSGGKVYAIYDSNAKKASIGNGMFIVYDDNYTQKTGIKLTIDKDIQDIAERECEKNLDMGCVVISDTETCEILSLVSKPGFSKDSLQESLNSDKGDFINRAFSLYTPGSVFKTAAACAALNEDIKYADKTYTCTGSIDVAGKKFACHEKGGHGTQNMSTAFANSCNTYFINLALEIGIDKITDMAKKLGCAKYSSINLLNTEVGNIPCKNLYLPANAANISIGQGEVMLTPIEVSSLISCAVTGKYTKPTIVKSFVFNSFEKEPENAPSENVLSENVCEKMREMFSLCISEGTGYRAKTDNFICGGKTATAQSGQYKDGNEVIHTWFCGFANINNKYYTICVLCDGNGENKVHPSEIFKNIAEQIYTAYAYNGISHDS